MTDSEFSPEEVAELRKLLEVEKIRKVKLLYSHLMDIRDFDALAQIFAEDAVCEFGPYGSWHGREEIHRNYCEVPDLKSSPPFAGFHITTNQWIELTGPTTAVSRAYLTDTVHQPDPRALPVIWYGTYDEDYEKIDGEWKIKRCQLQFLWPQRIVSEDFPRPMA